MKRSPSCVRLLRGALLTFLGTAPIAIGLFPNAAAAAAPINTGTVTGVVKDDEGNAIEGALVIVRCTCLSKDAEAYTNARGLFAIKSLPPGTYTVEAFFSDQRTKGTVELPRGEKRAVRMTISADVEKRVLHVKSPVKPNAEPGISLDSEALENLPGANTGGGVFETAMDIDPHGTQDAGGRASIGSTSAETDYRVNGASATGVTFNRPIISPVREFVDTVEVRGSGYEAEYGGFVGGVVEARRRSGSNKLRGTARFSFLPRLSKPRFTIRTDNALRTTETLDYQMQGVVSLSGPIIKDRLFWSGGIYVVGARSTLTQSFHHRVDRDGSGGYEPCPYRNGDHDCVDGGNYILTEKFGEQQFPTGGVSAQVFGGLDWAINPRHRLNASMFVSPQYVRRSFRRPVNLGSLDPDALGPNATADPVSGATTVANGVVDDHFGWDRTNGLLTTLGYQGRAARDSLEIDANVSYLQQRYVEAWKLDNPELRDMTATQEFSTSGKNLFDFLDAETRTGLAPGVSDACNDAGLPGESCPVRSWMSGGIGQYQRSTSRRIAGDFALTHFFLAQGSHQLKYGAQIDHSSRHRRLAYSGSNGRDFDGWCENEANGTGRGEACLDDSGRLFNPDPARVNNNRLIVTRSEDPSSRTSYGFGTTRPGELRALASPLGAGARVDAYDATVSAQNYGMFVQDKWAIRDNLFLSAGMRWDMQDMRDIHGERAVFIWDNVAPRVSFVYDWTREGKSRLYASYGWFYQKLPLSLLNRVYGGQVNVLRRYNDRDCQISRTVRGEPRDTRAATQPTEWCTDTNLNTTGLTEGAGVPRLRGQYDQQWTVGYEQEVIEDLTIGVSWLHKDLGRAVEDVSTNGGLDFILANPGEPVSASDVSQQAAACRSLSTEIDRLPLDAPGRSQMARELQRCEFLLDAYQRVGGLAKPRRTTDAFSLVANKRFGDNWMVVGSYTYSQVVGNYDGFVDPVSGAINLGSSTQFDTPELVRNSYGPLSFNSPHRFKLDGFYVFDLHEGGALTAGGSVRASSGYPISMRGGSNRYPGQFPIYVLPRGAGGRLEPNYQINAALQYAYPIGIKEGQEAMLLGVGLRLFNISNAKAVLRVDEVYTLDNTRAVAGAELSDLKHVKVQSSNSPTEFFQRGIIAPQGNFGVEAAFQMPLSAQFDLRLTF